MKLTNLLPFALVGLVGLVGCGGPEGTYKLDKDATKAAIDNEEGDKTAKEFGKALLDAMDASLELKKDGKYEMKSSMPSFTKNDEKTEKSESGDWKADGDKINFKNEKDEMACKLASGVLTCADKKTGKTSMVFKKS